MVKVSSDAVTVMECPLVGLMPQVEAFASICAFANDERSRVVSEEQWWNALL